MSFTYNIPNLINSLKLSQKRSVVRNVSNILTSTNIGDYTSSLRSLTEEYFFEPLKDLTEVDEFLMAGGSFNLPVFAPLVIELTKEDIVGGLKGAAGEVATGETSLGGGLLGAALGFRIDGVSISVSRSKNIVTTAVNGRDYTVKEFISNGDHEISVNGILASTGNGYPVGQVVQLRKILEKNTTLKVINALLQRMGIFEIVVTSYEFPSNDGIKNIQPFTFTAISEIPLEVEEGLGGQAKNIAKNIASRII
ncbi:DUF6046 domain-containing protein [Aquimarina gracilis]|uniref:DUF6046 domain-containing protein n=1 Tax=Aquimarina gracilis TaxID=874422 RepID=A0ABU5ZXG2_9FLAO|nr:DUF6046 domain-containing protein [Aquimarina gracilis]MEB3346522.1 DUF6046 domain-containing protein [Aquimarina gracilis]